MLSAPVVFVALLALLSSDCAVDSATTSAPGSATGSGSGSGLETDETCIGTPYNELLCREELLNLQSCIPRVFQPEQIMILLRDPVSTNDSLEIVKSAIDILGAGSECMNAALPWVCLKYFGLCDASGTAYRAPSSYCEVLSTDVCANEWEMATALFSRLSCNSSRLSDENSVDDYCFLQTNVSSTAPPTVNTGNALSLRDRVIISVILPTTFVILVIAIIAAVVICVMNSRRSYTIHLGAYKEEPKSIDNANYINDRDGIELTTTDQRISRAECRYDESQLVRSSIHRASPLSYEESMGGTNTAQGEEDIEQDSSDASYENSLTDSDSYVQQVTNEIEGHYEVQPKFWHPASEQNELKMQLAKLKLPVIMKDNVDILEQLGSGQFGTVHRGVWHHSNSEDNTTNDDQVAVKSIKVGATEKERVKFLQEAIIMGQFNNPQVLRILGVIAKGGDLQIVMELMHNGDLRSHVQTLKPGPGQPVPTELGPTLLSYSRQVACGLIYFCVKNFIHRDLAARNVLVSASGMCKIADFGLSRDLQDDDYYTSHGGKIPVKWTAPEALAYHKHSTKSDIWSFGCVLYEIWSLGCKPFHDVPNMEVIKKLENGYRLPPPPGCPRLVYHTMMKCWHPVPESRPAAGFAVAALSHPDFKIFDWSAKDIANNSEKARTLGATIEEGYTLYKDLQKSYRRPEGSRKRSKKHALQKIEKPAEQEYQLPLDPEQSVQVHQDVLTH